MSAACVSVLPPSKVTFIILAGVMNLEEITVALQLNCLLGVSKIKDVNTLSPFLLSRSH